MATIASRLTNTGTLLVNGTIDEVTYSGNVTFASKTQPNVVYTTGVFDEVTYNPTASSSAIKNLLSYSQDFTNSAWANYQQYANSVIITGNVTTAPDGTLTAGKFASNNAVSTYYSYFRGAITINPNTAYTYSTYFKAAERTSGSMVMYTTGYNNTINFDLSAGTVTGIIPTDPALTMTGGISSVGNGWYRVYYTFSKTASDYPQFKYGLDTGNIPVGQGFYVWGAQLEASSTPTIYQGVTAANTLIASSTVRKIDSTGSYYIQGVYDEYTGAPVVDNSLVLWLDAAQPASYPGTGATWYDMSSGINFGTDTIGSPSTFNVAPPSFNMNNTTLRGFASSTGSLPTLDTGTFTIEAWLLHTSFNASSQYNNKISHRENYNVSGFRFGVATPSALSTDTTGCPIFWTNQSGGSFSTSTPSYPILLNQWYQTVVTYDGTTCKVYYNGTVLTSTTGTFVIPTGRGYYLGTNESGMTSFNGNFSAYKQYNRALTPDEVQQNFNALRRRYGL